MSSSGPEGCVLWLGMRKVTGSCGAADGNVGPHSLGYGLPNAPTTGMAGVEVWERPLVASHASSMTTALLKTLYSAELFLLEILLRKV